MRPSATATRYRDWIAHARVIKDFKRAAAIVSRPVGRLCVFASEAKHHAPRANNQLVHSRNTGRGCVAGVGSPERGGIVLVLVAHTSLAHPRARSGCDPK